MPHPKGGRSVLSVYDGDKLVAQGVGKCMSSDNWSYREARHYALENLQLCGYTPKVKNAVADFKLQGFTFPVKANAQVVINQKFNTVESGASIVGIKIDRLG
jgi:hypothetical protein